MDDDLGCRCNNPTADRHEVALRCTGAAVCIGLFCMGFIMFKVPFEYADHFNTGQWLSAVAQGIATMLFTLAAGIDNIYGTLCIKGNFGFLSHLCGRGVFFVLMGLYSLPTLGMLNSLSESKNEDGNPSSDGAMSSLALFGVIMSFLVGILHFVLLFCRWRADQGDTKGLTASAGSPPPQSMGGQSAA
mmetsp:Transcript_107487/g.190432  ORF Transcript_107487/g.190432 Transcript_107487/m.190432 type:complete len:188 (+) Transcript_107487:35-598(+)